MPPRISAAQRLKAKRTTARVKGGREWAEEKMQCELALARAKRTLELLEADREFQDNRVKLALEALEQARDEVKAYHEVQLPAARAALEKAEADLAAHREKWSSPPATVSRV
jgi:hypothetical protein